MLWRSSTITDWSLRAVDGQIGAVKDLLFDDSHWGIRWLVVDTGSWLPGRQVILPPSALGKLDPAHHEVPVDLTREKIEESPDIARDMPVSRQLETDVYDYYGWTPHWVAGYGLPLAAPGIVGVGAPVPPAAPRRGAGRADAPEHIAEQRTGDPHLRSTGEVTGYYVEATDGNIGHIEDFLIDDEDWAVRYLIVDTKNWWPGEMVLIAPGWLREISWPDGQAKVELTREQVKSSPRYDPNTTVEREYEERLHRHYGQLGHWSKMGP